MILKESKEWNGIRKEDWVREKSRKSGGRKGTERGRQWTGFKGLHKGEK